MDMDIDDDEMMNLFISALSVRNDALLDYINMEVGKITLTDEEFSELLSYGIEFKDIIIKIVDFDITFGLYTMMYSIFSDPSRHSLRKGCEYMVGPDDIFIDIIGNDTLYINMSTLMMLINESKTEHIIRCSCIRTDTIQGEAFPVSVITLCAQHVPRIVLPPQIPSQIPIEMKDPREFAFLREVDVIRYDNVINSSHNNNIKWGMLFSWNYKLLKK
jgi:hypothetical protein